MNNHVTLQDAAKIIDRLGRYFPMLVQKCLAHGNHQNTSNGRKCWLLHLH